MGFTCKQFRLDKINNKTTAFNSLMRREPKEHPVNKMQNKPGITHRASTTLCHMEKIKIDICKFNNNNKIEMEVASELSRNSSSWAQLPI